jgi:hypothetical protein
LFTGRTAAEWVTGLCQHLPIAAESVEMMHKSDLAKSIAMSRERLKKLQAKAVSANGVR